MLAARLQPGSTNATRGIKALRFYLISEVRYLPPHFNAISFFLVKVTLTYMFRYNLLICL